MKERFKKIRIGVVGCGAIGSRTAKSIKNELKRVCCLGGLYDIDRQKALDLAKCFSQRNIVKSSLKSLISSCDFVIESVNSPAAPEIARKTLKAKKNILVMSVGRILNCEDIFPLAKRNKCVVLIPSGALSGLDAIKAARQVDFSQIILTTRKPLTGFAQSDYLTQKGIKIDNIDSEVTLFDGDVDTAITLFPKNINIAATLALASGAKEKIRIRILTSPLFKTNSHHIEATGPFGKIVTQTDNVVCPDNPKSSYMAVLSAIQTLKQFFSFIKIGT